METQPEQRKERQTAVKKQVRSIINGKFVKNEGWEASYVETTDGKKISRVNLIGIITQRSIDGQQSYTLDDGTGSIQLIVYNDNTKKEDLNVGDTALVIGTVREFGNSRLIIPESMKKIDPKWGLVRRKERSLELPEPEPKQESKEEKIDLKDFEEEIITDNPEQRIIDMIRQLDTGNGADIDEVILKSNIADAERRLTNLLATGEIFEITPGRIKLLE